MISPTTGGWLRRLKSVPMARATMMTTASASRRCRSVSADRAADEVPKTGPVGGGAPSACPAARMPR